ncbi:MAG: ABC transporter substrate-binding protein [Chloroflexi bacterium]|nr:MAG: ABC transporter substrate-binding protein [Chloroflexota bacterium]
MYQRCHLPRMLSILIIVLLLVAGCAPPQAAAPGAEGEAAATGKTQITMWVGTNEVADCVIKTAVDSFNEQSDTIEVIADKKADVINAVRPALAGGAGPDLVPTHGPAFVAELALADQVLPLDDFVDDFGWDELFVPWALNMGRIGGKLYSLPQELETVVLYYNKTLFEEKGWQPPANMDELVALADQIAAEEIIPFAGQAGECKACNEWYFTEFVNKVAGPEKVYQALKGEIPWTDPDFVLSIEILNEMMQKGYFMGSVENFLAANFDQFSTAFAQGQAAMNMEGTWFYGREAEYFGEAVGNSNEWDWVPMPSSSGASIYSIGIGGTQSINKNSQHPEAAAEFLTYYFSPEIQARLFSDCRLAVAPIRIEAEELEGIDPRIAAVFADMADASDAGNYGYTTWTFFPPKSDVYIYEEIEKVWVGDITAEEYLAGLDRIFQEEMAAGQTLDVPDR